MTNKGKKRILGVLGIGEKMEEIEKKELQLAIEEKQNQELLNLFGKEVVIDDDHVILYDPVQKTAQNMNTIVSRYSIHCESENFVFIVNRADYPYIRQIESRDGELSIARYLNEQHQEEIILTKINHDYEEPRAVSVCLIPQGMVLSETSCNDYYELFSSFYMKNRNHSEREKGKMRELLHPFYQQHKQMMQSLEAKHEDLKECANSLLPHRFEDVIGHPNFTIYK